MANDIKLQEGHGVDSNLRPLKVGGESTSLELANTDNGARIRGDLEVVGNTKTTIDEMSFNTIPAYSGMIIGYTAVGIDASAGSYTLSSTMTTIDDDLKVKFIAPPSGVVEIFAQIYFDAFRRVPVLGLSDQDTTDTYQAISFPNSQDDTNEHAQAVPPSSSGDSVLRPHWVVQGLTAGSTYEWWLGAKTSVSTGGVLRWGSVGTNGYPPFIMKATALPSGTGLAGEFLYG